MFDAKDYLISLYEEGLFNDIIVEGLICWLSTDDAEEFCRMYELGYDEYKEESVDE